MRGKDRETGPVQLLRKIRLPQMPEIPEKDKQKGNYENINMQGMLDGHGA